uniref:Uncharacterized protein n=1 Tax=Amphimedon queenslandica TaxID=400682 RepID=A0A1X7T4I0_AMPQE
MATRISSFSLFLFILISYTSGLLNPRSLKNLPRGNSESSYEYQTLYFKQPIDHFNFESNITFSQRYLLNDAFWDKDNGGPIFFYCGNEGDIT